MKAPIKLILCLLILCAGLTVELSAQTVGGTFPAPAELELRGTAAVPMSLVKASEKYNNYYQAPPVEGWLDDKKFIVKEYGKTASLLTYPQPDGQPTSILTFPLPAYDIYPSPDRKNYLYNQDTDGRLNYRMFVWNQESKQSAALTEAGTRAVQPIWSPSGKYVAYSYFAPGTKGMDIVWQNPFKPDEKKTVFSSPYMVQAVAWSKNDKYVAVEAYTNLADMTRLWLVEPQTGKTKMTTGYRK